MTFQPQSSFERDILDQPAALEAFASRPLPAAVTALRFASFDRIVLTGMGSSDYVTIPLELELARRSLPVWRIQTGCLLERLALITDRTLLWITSQSGRSGEVVALLDRLPKPRKYTIVATTNDPQSPLACGADHVVELHCGSEATVSSKSYLNSLASVHRVVAAIAGRIDDEAVKEIRTIVHSLHTAIARPTLQIDNLVERALASGTPRFALVGTGADAATSLTGALVLKEASKICAEGYSGGAFRHGPMELAGAGMTALLFGSGSRDDVTLQQLCRDLSRTGSLAVMVSPAAYDGAEHLAVPADNTFARMVHAMHIVQQICVGLARATGLEPGEFRFGQKITAQL